MTTGQQWLEDCSNTLGHFPYGSAFYWDQSLVCGTIFGLGLNNLTEQKLFHLFFGVTSCQPLSAEAVEKAQTH